MISSSLLIPMQPVTYRSWGIVALTIAYVWQLYTLWILVKLHEAVPGRRYNRYVELAQAAFGKNLPYRFFLSFILTNEIN
jgi:amino acid permease